MKNLDKTWIKILFIIGFIIIGDLSGILGVSNIQKTYYASIKLPPYSPPGWLFGPVWTVLYGLLGYQMHSMIIEEKSVKYHINNIVYIIGFVLNLLWSFVFFGQEKYLYALIMIISMWLITLYVLVFVELENKNTTKITQIPYILWLSFATALNLGIWLLN